MANEYYKKCDYFSGGNCFVSNNGEGMCKALKNDLERDVFNLDVEKMELCASYRIKGRRRRSTKKPSEAVIASDKYIDSINENK